jgi:hypothetical protein
MVGITSLLAFFASAFENKKAVRLNIEIDRYFGNPAVSWRPCRFSAPSSRMV